MYIVQTQFYTIMGFWGTHHHHQPTLIDSIGSVVVMFLVSYSYHTDKIIQTYTNTATHKHMRSHYWKTPTLRTTHRNPKTRTHKIQTSIKTQTLTNTDGQTQNCSSLHIRISCHCLFCPAISPISGQSLIEMKVLQQCLSASYSCPTSMPQLLYSCSQFFTALVQLQFFLTPLFLSFPESKHPFRKLDNV